MKKILFYALLIMISTAAFAQEPQGFNYQAAIRDNSGNLLLNQAVKLRFTIRNLTVAGTAIYQETQNLTTNGFGLVNCVIGEGTVVSGAYPNMGQWATGAKYLQIEADPAGGNSFTDLGTMQIMSVPYANYAGTAGLAINAEKSDYADSLGGTLNPSKLQGAGAVSGQVLKWNGTSWIPDVDNSGGSGGSDNWGTQTVVANSTLSGNGTSGNPLKIAQQGASSGQILKWNGTTWAPANDSTSGGSYTGGTGIIISGGAINSTWTASGNDIISNNSGNVGISGNLGIDGTAPDNTYVIKSSGSGNREMLLDATGSGNFSGINLRGSAGTNDFLYIRKYGTAAVGTYADGTAYARSVSLVSGNSVNRFILGGLSNTSDLHLLTAGRTRLQIDKDGNMYTGAGISPGARLLTEKGTKGYLSPTGSYFAPSIDARQDTTIPGYFPTGVSAYGAGNRGAIGGAFIAGRKSSDSSSNYGIYGEAASVLSNNASANYGVYTYTFGAKSNYGSFLTAYADRASTTNVGVYGYASGESKSTTVAYGIYGAVEKASTMYAGYFNGNVHVAGTLTGTTKSFLIDHPLDPANKYLQFTSVESPDMMNVFSGNIVTDQNGIAIVVMPDYFEASNTDFKYQLTVIGQFAQAIIKEKISDNRFIIQTDKPSVEVSWQVTTVRNDAFAQKHRIVPEYEKAIEHRGKYLDPEVHNQPQTKGIHYINPPEQAPFRKQPVSDGQD